MCFKVTGATCLTNVHKWRLQISRFSGFYVLPARRLSLGKHLSCLIDKTSCLSHTLNKLCNAISWKSCGKRKVHLVGYTLVIESSTANGAVSQRCKTEDAKQILDAEKPRQLQDLSGTSGSVSACLPLSPLNAMVKGSMIACMSKNLNYLLYFHISSHTSPNWPNWQTTGWVLQKSPHLQPSPAEAGIETCFKKLVVFIFYTVLLPPLL